LEVETKKIWLSIQSLTYIPFKSNESKAMFYIHEQLVELQV